MWVCVWPSCYAKEYEHMYIPNNQKTWFTNFDTISFFVVFFYISYRCLCMFLLATLCCWLFVCVVVIFAFILKSFINDGGQDLICHRCWTCIECQKSCALFFLSLLLHNFASAQKHVVFAVVVLLCCCPSKERQKKKRSQSFYYVFNSINVVLVTNL